VLTLIAGVVLGCAAGWLAIGLAMDMKLTYRDVVRGKFGRRWSASFMAGFHWLTFSIYLACWPIWEKWDQESDSREQSNLEPGERADGGNDTQRAVKAMQDALDVSKPRF